MSDAAPVTSHTAPDDHTHHRSDQPRHPHGHVHGHHHDRGLPAVLRYLRLLPLMWRSELNEAVVRHLALKPGELVVDLGAGAGAATVEAAKQGAEVIAVDPMPFMRAVLRLRRLGHRGRKTITVHDGAAEAIPAGDQTVDALWTVNTLHHWTDREAASRELARVLKPGGRVLLLDEDFDDPSHPEHDRIRASRRRSGLMFDEVDPDALALVLKAAGFAHAEGSQTHFSDRPVKLVRATR